MERTEPSILKALIIDDEKSVRLALLEIIQRECPEVQVVGEAGSIPEAVREIHARKPDLLFLDIEMPGYTGLQILEFFNPQEITFDVIFVTAYNEYALQAFKISAFDYLLKPVDPQELRSSLQRYLQRGSRAHLSERLRMVKDNLLDGEVRQLAISMQSGIEFVNINEIVMLEASGIYTVLKLTNGSKLVSSKPLGEFEEILKPARGFYRTHRSYIVNMSQVRRLSSQEGDMVILKDGTEVALSRYRKKEFEDAIKAFRI
ncbi:MAG: LytTR family DNA-binding domain-containing protein [Cyclobacteriaceae bacterium]